MSSVFISKRGGVLQGSNLHAKLALLYSSELYNAGSLRQMYIAMIKTLLKGYEFRGFKDNV